MRVQPMSPYSWATKFERARAKAIENMKRDFRRDARREKGVRMTLNDLLEKARNSGPMTDEQRREQAADFAFGQLALTKEWRGRPISELDQLRALCRKLAGLS